MRLYVLSDAFSPLVAYMYRGGFARAHRAIPQILPISPITAPFNETDAIQKTAALRSRRGQEGPAFGKTVASCRTWHGGRRSEFLAIGKSCSSVKSGAPDSQHVMIADKHCFELYGYDVLIDDELCRGCHGSTRAVALSANTKEDYQLKSDMLHDGLDIVDVEARLRGDERSWWF